MSSSRKEHVVICKDLCVHTQNAAILSNVSFSVAAGEFLGIVGESGAGKTTLLRLLSRRVRLQDGVTISGTGVLPPEVWLVAQENVLYDHDTPLSTVSFLHRLLYESTTEKADDEATRLLLRVGVPELVIRQRIGNVSDGISVGNRRLVNVALALCAKSKVILLDEPTTGLDSSATAELMRVVREVCHTTGCACICTIHQPSDEAVQYFDRLVAMNGGKLYCATPNIKGSTPNTLDPSHHNVSECLLYLVKMNECETTTCGEVEGRTLLANPLRKVLVDDVDTTALVTASLYHQLKLLSYRYFIREVSDKFALPLRATILIVMYILLGIGFWDLPYDKPQFLQDHMGFYLGMSGVTFVSIVMSAGAFPLEKNNFVDSMNQTKHYSLVAFTMARAVVDVIVGLFVSVACAFSAMSIASVPDGQLRFFFVVFLQLISSEALGFALSTKVRPEVAIGAVIPGLGFLGALLGSGLASVEASGTGWIFNVAKYASFFRYSFTALVVEQLPKVTGHCNPGLDPGCVFANSTMALDFLRLEPNAKFPSTYGFQVIIMVAMFVALRLLGYVLLRDLIRGAKHSYSARSSSGHAVVVTEEDTASVIHPTEPYETPQPTKKTFHFRASITTTPRSAFWQRLSTLLRRPHREVLTSATMQGIARSGEVCAVLAPSHGGKSLMVKALSQIVPIQGLDTTRSHLSMWWDEEEITATTTNSQQETTTRVVYQNDAFVTGDTPYKVLHRQMMLSGKEPDSLLIRKLLCSVRLGHLLTRPVEQMSGGEQRRLSIASQLVHRPQVLLLDEPTSGLDSELAFVAMQGLREYAKESNTVVICTLQQPGNRLLPLIDRFHFLSGSATMFEGSLEDSVVHFGVTAEECEMGRAPTDAIIEKLRSMDASLDMLNDPSVVPPKHSKTSSRPRRRCSLYFALRALLRRQWSLRVRKAYLFELTGKFILFPLFISVLFINVKDPMYVTRAGLMVILVGCTCFSGIVLPAVLACLEAPVVEREVRAGDYHPAINIASRWLFEPIPELIFQFIGFCIFYAIVGMDPKTPLNGIITAAYISAYHASFAIGSIVGNLRLPLAVSCGLAALMAVMVMLASDSVITPRQVDKTKILYAVEVMSPVRSAYVLTLHALAESSPLPGRTTEEIMAMYGLDRSIDTPQAAWGLMAMVLVLTRVVTVVTAHIGMSRDQEKTLR